MKKNPTPESIAFKINHTLRLVFREDSYGASVEDIIREFSPKLVPNYELEIHKKPLSSIDGALITSTANKKSIILINDQIESIGRYNFTLAHEFGHFLMHLTLQEQFSCSGGAILGFSKDKTEIEANRFASQLILPNDIVRKVADSSSISLDDVYRLAKRRNASLSATGLACVGISSRPIGFACISNGFVEWGMASESARKTGLYFKRNEEVPASSSTRFEDGKADKFLSNHVGVEGWSANELWKEDGFYSSRYDRSYLLLYR